MSGDAYARLIALLDEHGAAYRLIDHAPEGRTEIVSPMRGNPLAAAAKCIVLMVKLGKKTTRHVLAVVPGDARLDLGAVKALLGATYAAFASPEVAEELAASSEEQSASTQEIASSANQLADAADKLTGAVKSFRLLADETVPPERQAAD